MLWTRYRLLALLAVACLAAAAAVGDPLDPGVGYSPATLLALVGAEYLLLAVYAGLNGAYPRPATVAAAVVHLVVFAVLVVATAEDAVAPTAAAAAPTAEAAAGATAGAATGAAALSAPLATVAVDRLPLLLVLTPIPAAFSLGASSRASDRGPYVVGAALVTLAGPVLANMLLAAAAASPAAAGPSTPELATLTAATVALVAGLPPYLAARRRKPGFRDRYPSLDELPVSRASVTVVGWALLVVSGWGPLRVASGAAVDRAWGIVPPDDVLAVPFLALMAVLGVFAAGLLDDADRVERAFGVVVLAYLVGVLAAFAVFTLDVPLDRPRYLGFAAVLVVSALAAVVAVRRVG